MGRRLSISSTATVTPMTKSQRQSMRVLHTLDAQINKTWSTFIDQSSEESYLRTKHMQEAVERNTIGVLTQELIMALFVSIMFSPLVMYESSRLLGFFMVLTPLISVYIAGYGPCYLADHGYASEELRDVIYKWMHYGPLLYTCLVCIGVHQGLLWYFSALQPNRIDVVQLCSSCNTSHIQIIQNNIEHHEALYDTVSIFLTLMITAFMTIIATSQVYVVYGSSPKHILARMCLSGGIWAGTTVRLLIGVKHPTADVHDTVFGLKIATAICLIAMIALDLQSLPMFRQLGLRSRQLFILIHRKDSVILSQKGELAGLTKSLAAAQTIVKNVMKEGGSLLEPYKLKFSEIEIDENHSLGEGSFGTVLKGRFRGIDVAIKTVRSTKVTKQTMRSYMHELKIMAPLRHENLVTLLGGCWEDGPDKLCLVLELCPNGSLADLLHNPGNGWENRYYAITRGIVHCFVYLHHGQAGEALIHRDLKPHNVLIASNMIPKVADFGESRRFDSEAADQEAKDQAQRRKISGHEKELSMTMVGTPKYCAPEILRGASYSSKVDVFSFAMTLFEMVCRSGLELSRQFQRVSSTDVIQGWRPTFPANVQNSRRLIDLTQKCWHTNPQLRPTFETIASSLEEIGTQNVSSHVNQTHVDMSSEEVLKHSDGNEMQCHHFLGLISELNEGQLAKCMEALRQRIETDIRVT